jgi:hypothetical protein
MSYFVDQFVKFEVCVVNEDLCDPLPLEFRKQTCVGHQ